MCLHLVSINFIFCVEHQVYITCFLCLGLVMLYYVAMFSIVIKCKHLQMYKFKYMCGASVSRVVALLQGMLKNSNSKPRLCQACGCSPILSWRASSWSRSPSHCFFQQLFPSDTRSTMEVSSKNCWRGQLFILVWCGKTPWQFHTSTKWLTVRIWRYWVKLAECRWSSFTLHLS